MIRAEDVSLILQRRLGPAAMAMPEMTRTLTELLNGLKSGVPAFSVLAEKIGETLFDGLYALLGPGMKIRLDDGSVRRVMLSELEKTADELLFLIMERLPVNDENCRELRDYFMRCGSVAAARVLSLHFMTCLDEKESALICRMLEMREVTE